MSLYLVAGHGAATAPASAGGHLLTARPRRYPSDTADTEWQLIAGYIPVGGTVTGRGGGPVTYLRRDIVDAIRYVDHNSCHAAMVQWSMVVVMTRRLARYQRRQPRPQAA
jgi:hypothetical protein